ncbi:hypothetical protein EIP86_003684 [Pleurotus ostreatoroseus]|nr:hypothetical protein EIP86_003684 [Pleurotus ostreatoroseus]
MDAVPFRPQQKLNSRKASRGRGINEEDDIVAPSDGKAPAARSHEVDPTDFARRHGPISTFELGPVTSRNDLSPLDINRRGKFSMDSETLRDPMSPSSM